MTIMEPLYIDKTRTTPLVSMDSKTGIFEISGRSLPEDVEKFYNKIIDWLDFYCKNPTPKTILNIKFDYFNSSSARIIVKMLISLERIKKAGKEVEIHWFHKSKDFLIKTRGLEIQSVMILPFFVEESKD